ncbi:MAG: hypothetical protein WD766_09350 [Gemmatimonadota bacterium]
MNHDIENRPPLPFGTPTIEVGVPGPRKDEGLLLRAPSSEELAWDLGAEIVSARLIWMEDRQAWWIAASYLETVVSIVLRSFPSVLVLGIEEDRLLSRDGLRAVQGRLL